MKLPLLPSQETPLGNRSRSISPSLSVDKNARTVDRMVLSEDESVDFVEKASSLEHQIREALLCPRGKTPLEQPVFSRRLGYTVSKSWADSHASEAGEVVADILVRHVVERAASFELECGDARWREMLLEQLCCPLTFDILEQPIIGGRDGYTYSFPILHDYFFALQRRTPPLARRAWSFSHNLFLSPLTRRPQNLGDCHPHELVWQLLRLAAPEQAHQPPPRALPVIVDPRAMGLPAAFGTSSRSSIAWQEVLLLFSSWRRPRIKQARRDFWFRRASFALKKWEAIENRVIEPATRRRWLKPLGRTFGKLHVKLPQLRSVALIYADILLARGRYSDAIAVLEALRDRDIAHGYPAFTEVAGRLLVLYARKKRRALAHEAAEHVEVLRGGAYPWTELKPHSLARLVDLRLDWGAAEYALLNGDGASAHQLLTRAASLAEQMRGGELYDIRRRLQQVVSLNKASV